MKKNILFVFAIVLSASAAFGASLRDTVINKILSIQVQKFLTPEFISSVISTRTPDFDEAECSFADSYYVCRDRTYESLFGGWEGLEDAKNNDSDNDDLYYQLRTVAVAKLKAELHQGDTLMEVYQNCRPAFVKTIARQSPAFRQHLQAFIEEAIESFTSVKDKDYRSKFSYYLEVQNVRLYGVSNSIIENMLASNRPAEEIAKQVLNSPVAAEDKSFQAPPDVDLSKFALRRWNEGGTTLVGKYLAVLQLMQKDLATPAFH